MSKRAVIYARNSDELESRSVEEQVEECQRVCAQEGWPVACVIEEGKSGYRANSRSEFASLIRFIAEDKADVLVTWEGARGQRNLPDYVTLETVCADMNVPWHYSGKLHDLNNAADRFVTGLDALLARRSSDDTRDRVLRTSRMNIEKGKPWGKRPYGYDRKYAPDNRGKLVPVEQFICEPEAEIVREIASRIGAGESTYAITEDFNRRKPPVLPPSASKYPEKVDPDNPPRWNPTQVKRIATNPVYIAKRRHHGQVVADGNWEPILDDATHYQLVARLNDPKRKTVRDGATKHLLTGVATCGVCGGKIKRNKIRGVVQYQCDGKRCVARKMESVDALVVNLIIARLSQPDAAELFVEREHADAEVESALAVIAEKRARLQEAADQYAAGKLSVTTLSHIEARLEGEINELEQGIRRIKLPSVAYDLAKRPAEVWEGLSVTQRREVIRGLLDVRIMRSNSKRGSRRFDPDSIKVTWKHGTPEAA